jgi:TetR/AcrR family transcriptional repressor of nem operon
MPRVSRQQAKLNRKSIVENAARLFRERGFRNIPLSEVMSSSGLTLGGFYGHFESREALTNEACRHAFEQAIALWTHMIAEAPDKRAARKSIIDDYLSQNRILKSGSTCPVVAFSSEVAQEDDESAIHKTYSEGLAGLIGTYMETLENPTTPSQPQAMKQHALLEYSVMIGALTLARAARHTGLSDDIVASARAFLGIIDNAPTSLE